MTVDRRPAGRRGTRARPVTGRRHSPRATRTPSTATTTPAAVRINIQLRSRRGPGTGGSSLDTGTLHDGRLLVVSIPASHRPLQREPVAADRKVTVSPDTFWDKGASPMPAPIALSPIRVRSFPGGPVHGTAHPSSTDRSSPIGGTATAGRHRDRPAAAPARPGRPGRRPRSGASGPCSRSPCRPSPCSWRPAPASCRGARSTRPTTPGTSRCAAASPDRRRSPPAEPAARPPTSRADRCPLGHKSAHRRPSTRRPARRPTTSR